MNAFLTRFAALVRSVLSGFDRLFFCGALRNLAHCRGLQNYLWAQCIPSKDFAAHSLEVTARLEEASFCQAHELGREVRYLNSVQHRKEDIAGEIAERDRIRNGLICVLRDFLREDQKRAEGVDKRGVSPCNNAEEPSTTSRSDSPSVPGSPSAAPGAW